MNPVEQSIYNDGELVKTEVFTTMAGEELKDEYILCDGVLYCFTFLDGELTNFRTVKGG